MVLAKHVDPEELIEKLKLNAGPQRGRFTHHLSTSDLTPYSNKYSINELAKHKIPEDGVSGESAAQLIRDELDLDGRPNLNLASFVHTWMEPEADRLVMENISKNLADADEYPALMDIHARCISILAHLWGVQKGEQAIGTATTGSSEAIHLGGLAMKQLWKEKRQAAGKDISKPNIIMGANAQVALEKFARYFDVEARILPVTRESRFVLDPKLIRENLDENTIGVFVILGSTYTGHYEDVEAVSDILDDYEKESGNYIPIHVDGASGAFVAPFSYAGAGPGKKWNFELPRVHSINVSGHKFGLSYVGIGFLVFRDLKYLPKHLIFELHYLGGTEQTFTLSFSRPGAQVIGQYYNLIHLGFNGYRQIMEHMLSNARLLSNALEATGWYECASDIHRQKGIHAYKPGEKAYDGGDTSEAYNAGLPVVAFSFNEEFRKEHPHVKQEALSKLLRIKNYIVPNYPLPPHEEKQEILRVVVRESMPMDLLDRLITDICSATETLIEMDGFDLAAFVPFPKKESSSKGSTPSGHRHEGIHKGVC